MTTERWMRLSAWHNAWLAADAGERERLAAELAVTDPALSAEAEELAAMSAALPGFLETPAFVLAAPELAKEEPLLAADDMLGPYRIVGLIARGGMGDVYRATDVRLRRDVAVKVLAPDQAGDARRVDRFLKEARITAALDHPNIVRLYDVGSVDGRPYLVAELLDGETLRARLERGALPVEEALRIGADAAGALVAAHAAGSVHRDLKPENIFLTRTGTTKILDFGIAKFAEDPAMHDGLSTLTGIVLGTAGYLAPEQIRAGDIDARADLFALGATLFEMLTGRRAFAREHIVETLHATLHEDPPDLRQGRPETPPALATLVTRLLAKTPEARPGSAAELVSALKEIAGNVSAQPGAASHPEPRSKAALSARRFAGPAVALTVVAIVLALAGGRIPRRSAAPAPAGVVETLAILPFRSLPDSADGQLLELGLTDVFVARLSQLPGIRVLPLSATERLRDADPREAGKKLGADRVLAGTVQRDRDRVRASVRLLSIPDGRAIWSSTFDAHAASAFSIQDAVVTRVLQEIGPHVSSALRARLVEPGTRNGEAYEHYLRGRAHAVHVTGADFSRAAESFRSAVKLDPGYADAWAALAAACRRIPIAGGVRPEGPFEEAKRAAGRSLELVPDHGEALSVLGTVAFWYEWDYPRAEELLRRAATLHPGVAESQVYLAHLLSNLGRHDEALVEIRRARELDPDLPIARSLEGAFLFAARRYGESLAHLDSMVSLAPGFVQGHVMRASPLLALGRYDEGIRALDLAAELEAGIPRTAEVGPRVYPGALRGYALGKAGRRAEAEATLEAIRGREREAYVPPQYVALVLHGLGRDDEALAELMRAVEVRDVTLAFTGVDPRWDELRRSPSFKAVMSRLNLLEVSNRTCQAAPGC